MYIVMIVMCTGALVPTVEVQAFNAHMLKDTVLTDRKVDLRYPTKLFASLFSRCPNSFIPGSAKLNQSVIS